MACISDNDKARIGFARLFAHNGRAIRSLFCLAFLLSPLLNLGIAQPLQGAALAEKETEWRNCTGGYYTGPREGRRNFGNDKYLWVVTPEFAKRFCMPERMVSQELKGAEAIAFRMVDAGDDDRCGVDDGGLTTCAENSKARFEIYLSQSLNLPSANPTVRYFYGGLNDSGMHISGRLPEHESGVGERLNRGHRYRNGGYQLPEGRTPRFSNPYHHPDPGHLFSLIYAHGGKGRWPVGSLWEVGFQRDWTQGIDMVVLEQQLGINFTFELEYYKRANLQPGTRQGQYLIVLDKRDSQSGGKKLADKAIPQDHAHVIYLPYEFALTVRTASMRQGGSWLEFVKTHQQR